jgi:hypothetical protein
MLMWNPNLCPRSGYVFIDADGIRHEARGLESLISKLAEYRIRREMPIGDPIAEVHAYLCALYPRSCQRADTVPESVLAQTRMNAISSDVGVWLRETWRKAVAREIVWVPDKGVKARVETCTACPYHEKATGACSACQESLNVVSFQLRAGRDRLSHKLFTCSRYRRDARVDVLLEQPSDPAAPPNCWKHPAFSSLSPAK